MLRHSLQIAASYTSVQCNTHLAPPLHSKLFFQVLTWSCIASKRGDHKHKIMARLFKPRDGAVSQAVLQLVVASLFFAGRSVPLIFASFRGVQNLQNFGLRLFFLIRKHIIVEHFLNDFHLIFAEIRDASLTSLLLLWFVQSSKYDEQTVIQKIEKILKNSNKH